MRNDRRQSEALLPEFMWRCAGNAQEWECRKLISRATAEIRSVA